MAQQTAMQALVELLKVNDTYKECMPYMLDIIEEVYLPLEKRQLSDAMMYALDEDGHTGDWKVKFINDYYESNFGVRPK